MQKFEEIYEQFLKSLSVTYKDYRNLFNQDIVIRIEETIYWYFITNHRIDDDFPKQYCIDNKLANVAIYHAVYQLVSQGKVAIHFSNIKKNRRYLFDYLNSLHSYDELYAVTLSFEDKLYEQPRRD